MKFRMDQLLSSISVGFDSVEKEIFGATTNHGRRIAYLCILMGKYLGYTEDELITAASCAILHDNALTELYKATQIGENVRINMLLHCEKGEENVCTLPFRSDAKNIVKYHHEFKDKKGPFRLDADETPLSSQLIAIADDIDVRYDLSDIDEERHAVIRKEIGDCLGNYYTRISAEAMLSVLDWDCVVKLKNENIVKNLSEIFPKWIFEGPARDFMGIAEITAGIVDNKSAYTAKHSVQIANRAYWMAKFYRMDEETCSKVYIAAALHDIGKMVTPKDILEKPGRLTDEEFAIIKEHVMWSYIMLDSVDGLEEICKWAVTHHRKLDGSGYPELPPDMLDDCFVCRLMACIDIYQAVRETRPYHSGRTHAQTIAIMMSMVERGEIDAAITADLDTEMRRFKTGDGDVPHPEHQKRHTIG